MPIVQHRHSNNGLFAMRHMLLATTLLASALLPLASNPASAGWREPQQRMVLVDIDGERMRDVPEWGSVVIVPDNAGRRLVIDRRTNEVIGFEVPAWQVRPNREARNPRQDFRRPQRDWGYGMAPQDIVPPGGLNGDEEFVAGFPERPVERRPLGLPQATVEPRDLNPVTGTVPKRTPEAKAAPQPGLPATPKLSKLEVAALQVYLDRQGMSPGVIDGVMGSNVQKAIDAYAEKTGDRIDANNTDDILQRLSSTGGLAFTTYEITSADAAENFVAAIPADYGEKAKLERLGYTSASEMLAERFHMDEAFLKSLNPGVDFSRPGTRIKVVAPGQKKTGSVARIIADKGRKQVRGYDASGRLVVAYPATIGSSDTPSPSGEVRIERVARNPGYTYNPKINFKQGNNDRVLSIPPGPNGPVGTVWIALSKPTYGIHGTPEPSQIGKTASHGCVRLTNFDAEELAGLVTPGVTVTFTE